MGEIKSAWEIAQEKAERLGELSPEEQRKQKEERCDLIGKALAERYLGRRDARYLPEELSKYSGEEKELINQAAVARLIETIELGKGSTLETAGKGICSLVENRKITETMDRLKELFQEYQQVVQKKREDIERAGNEILHQLRVSGTAISQINSQAKEEWRQSLSLLAQPFEARLSKLKQELMEYNPSPSTGEVR